MKPVRALLALAIPAALAGTTSGQVIFAGNEIQLSNGGEAVYIYNSPSVGGPAGMPTLGADLAYKGVPQNRMRTTSGIAGITTFEDIFIGDVDWPGGAPDAYDIGIANSSAEFGAQFDNLIPDFFTTTSLTALVSLGNTGFPHPCVVSPTSTCTGSASCPPPITGYVFDLVLGSPIAVAATPSSDLLAGTDGDLTGTHIVNFLPGGMVFSASGLVGSCASTGAGGDYVFMGAQSTDENQADYLNVAGTSWCEGFQLGDPAGISPTGPLTDFNTTMLEINFGLAENVVEPVITDNSLGYGPERGGSGLGLDSQTGGVTIASQTTADPSLAGSLCFPAVALSQLPVSVPVFGAGLMVSPDGTFNSTLAAYAGTGPLIGVDEDGDGFNDQAEALSIGLPLPAVPGPSRAYMQSFIVTGVGPITAVESTVFAIDLR